MRNILAVLVVLAGALYVVSHVEFSSDTIPAFVLGSVEWEAFDTGTLLFVGDIMLARSVESISDVEGAAYPFASTSSLIQTSDIAVGNFEGTVPEVHVPTPDFNLQFSVASTSLSALRDTGFDVLSLANNHALDYGTAGYEHTQKLCSEYGVSCVGHPRTLDDRAMTVVRVGETNVGLLFLHTLYGPLDPYTLSLMVTELSRVSDIQIAYIHWGIEYEQFHAKPEEELAHALIDSGIDAVVGHHPHVVQDIELYSGKPIFYSLGNFVFDQYFTDEVQQGLGIRLTVTESELDYELLPFTSLHSRSKPTLMDGESLSSFVDRYRNSSFIDFENAQYPHIRISRK